VSDSANGRGDLPAAHAAGTTPSVPFSPHGTLNLIFLVLIVAGLAVLWSFGVSPKSGRLTLPFSDRELPELCQHVVATGRPCPSCGLTRSLIYALHADPDRSREYHRAGLPTAIMLLLQVAMRVVFLRPSQRSAALDVVVSAGMLVAFAVLVNRW
jgi:hypothetical protein